MNKTFPSTHWQKTLLPEDATIQQAIECLNASALQIALVVASDKRLLGTITDGDIRRGLLRNQGLSSQARAIMNPNAVVVPPEMDRQTAIALMSANKLRNLPIVDQSGIVQGLHLWDELTSPALRDNLMIIMAGGLGKRLRPHTEACPKPLIPVADKPIMEHIIVRARLDGFHSFVVSLHYLGHMIEEYFGDGSRWDVDIHYVHEEEMLGTAGALSLLEAVPNAPFIVSNGDVLTDIRYGEILDFHLRHSATATMAVRQHEWQQPFGVVETDGIKITGFEEKPIHRSHVNAGIYALSPEALKCLNTKEHCDMPTLFERLRAKDSTTIVYPMHEPWIDVGNPTDLKTAEAATRRSN